MQNATEGPDWGCFGVKKEEGSQRKEIFAAAAGWSYVLASNARSAAMAILLSTLFWDKKVRIALLTLATFAALC